MRILVCSVIVLCCALCALAFDNGWLSPGTARVEPGATQAVLEPVEDPPPPAALASPAREAVALEEAPVEPRPVDALATARMVLAVTEEALAVELRADVLEENVSDEWLPTRDSLAYWVLEHQLGQVRDLPLTRVAQYLGEDDPDYALVADRDGVLADVFPFPGEADIDRLWNDPHTRALFAEALVAKHYSALVEDRRAERIAELQSRATSLDVDPLLGQLTALRDEFDAVEAQWWDALWSADIAYPHWSFLMRVVRHHFQ